MVKRTGRAFFPAAVTGATAAVSATAVLAILLFAANPLFFDDAPATFAFFLLIPAALGAVLGLVVAFVPLRRYVSRRGATAGVLVALLLLTALHAASLWREAHPRRLLQSLVIGVDGATWSVIRPLQERGELPAFARLEKEGASATCLSLVPMFSNRIFTSIAT